MRLTTFAFVNVLWLSGCAVVDTGALDEKGHNGIERAVQQVIGMKDLDGNEIKGPALPELANKTENNSIEVHAKDVPVVSEDATEGTVFQTNSDTQVIASAESVETDGEESLVDRFPDAKPPEVALKKYIDLKHGGEAERPLVPPKRTNESPDARKLAFKEKFPGVVIFLANDVSFQTSSLAKLEELAQRISKNPDETVLFQAQLAEGEGNDLAERRFKGVRDYMNKKLHIQPGRLVLDEKRSVGDWPQFQMYILKLGVGGESLAAGK